MVRIEVMGLPALGLDHIKAATDGVMAAAQWMPQATVADTAKFHARLLAAGITATPADVVDLLRDPAGATLGPRKRLITRGGLVSPSDHLAVAGVVALAGAQRRRRSCRRARTRRRRTRRSGAIQFDRANDERGTGHSSIRRAAECRGRPG